jgi:hypothetical protein
MLLLSLEEYSCWGGAGVLQLLAVICGRSCIQRPVSRSVSDEGEEEVLLVGRDGMAVVEIALCSDKGKFK